MEPMKACMAGRADAAAVRLASASRTACGVVTASVRQTSRSSASRSSGAIASTSGSSRLPRFALSRFIASRVEFVCRCTGWCGRSGSVRPRTASASSASSSRRRRVSSLCSRSVGGRTACSSIGPLLSCRGGRAVASWGLLLGGHGTLGLGSRGPSCTGLLIRVEAALLRLDLAHQWRLGRQRSWSRAQRGWGRVRGPVERAPWRAAKSIKKPRRTPRSRRIGLRAY